MDETPQFPLPEKPALRPDLQVFPVKLEDDSEAFLFNDPLSLVPGNPVVPTGAMAIIEFLDGKNDMREIQAEVVRHFDGTLVPLEIIEDLIRQLDENYMLLSDRLQHFITSYAAQPVREAIHAGHAYPENPDELRPFLDMGFTHEDGPGETKVAADGKELVALIAPHIDMNVAASSFAWAYRAVQNNEPADLYVILGVAHMAAQTHLGEYIPILLTRKNFETPLGTLETDADFVDLLAKRLKFDAFEGELIHRQEHSVELQAVWLAHLLGGKKEFKIAAGLVGGFHEQVNEKKRPEEDANIANMIESLRGAIEDYPGRVCVISGSDLAHVGPKFDGPPALDDETAKRVESKDREMLAHLEGLDHGAFYDYIAKEKNERNICGYGSIYTTLAVTSPTDAHLLAYDQFHEESTKSLVSFTSMAFFGKPTGGKK
jgi:AmmeMemoRadiSam system protein B